MRRSTLFRIASDPVARIGSFVAPRIIPADAVEAEPALYLGGGRLVNLPELEQVLNGTASRIEVTLSGITDELARLAHEDAPTVKGALCHVGAVTFDANWQIVAVEWLGILKADYLTVARQGQTRSVTLSLSTDETDRSKAPISFWTNADQQRRSPTDRFCDHVAGIAQGTSRRFGPQAD